MKKAIVNLSTLKYARGQYRLSESLKGKTDADVLLYKSERHVDAPSHSQSNYAFKAHSFRHAKELGYEIVLWLDASMNVIKDLKPIFDEIEKRGYYFQNSGWENNQWTNGRTKAKYGDDGSMFSSGVLGLNFNNPTAVEFFNRWYDAMDKGYFHGSHEDHRHDQTLGSIIANDLGMIQTPNNTHWNYGKEPKHENILILADGIV